MKLTPKPVTLHVINHTHWDREWFVPYTFTRRWIPRLIKNIDAMVETNPDYQYLFDGQTGALEDLETTDPEVFAIAHKLIRNHNLLVGPYYSQIEIRMPGPESLVRNLRIGIDKTQALGGSTEFAGWCVDMFGHNSQSPQIHAMFGIKDMYLWRGPSAGLEPFFLWKGADGTAVRTTFLFAGGYRNFYKVTSKARLALPRLRHEVRKLRPYYPAGHIPVFDGFDLDYEPGDAASYFAEYYSKKLERQHVSVVNSSPYIFAKEMRKVVKHLPEMSGELISGKYSSVFPGLLSNRSYSKLAADHCERLLYRYAEPLCQLLPADQYPEAVLEEQCKLILQNLVHDVISGCSIDQVHEIAEHRAAEVDTTLRTEITNALGHVSGELKDGLYAYAPATGATRLQMEQDGKLYQVESQGIGIVSVKEVTQPDKARREVETFTWKNRHYTATLNPNGSISLNGGEFGRLVVRDEEGDTYWDEPRGPVSELSIDGPIRVEMETDTWAKVSFTASARTADRTVTAKVSTVFDDSPLLKWHIQLDSTGTGFSVLFRQNYNQKLSKLYAGMPFDNVERPFIDMDLLGPKLDPALASVLNASSQRDLTKTFTFPFHEYVSPVSNPKKVHVIAKGLRAYQTEEPGNIDIVLSRPVDWLMKPSHHEYHSGDAGPKYYVPSARSQREIEIECALLVSDQGPDTMEFHQAVDQYVNPPLLFRVAGSEGKKTSLPIFDEDAVISSAHLYNGKRLVRMYNPTSRSVPLRQGHTGADRHGHTTGKVEHLLPKKIETVVLGKPSRRTAQLKAPKITAMQWLPYPVRPDTSKPDPEGMAALELMREGLQKKVDELQNQIMSYGSSAEIPSSLQHRFYVTARECMEARLSLFWNNSTLQGVDPLVVDEKLYELATEYNDLRIMRRMYDYIIDIDSHGSPGARPKSTLLRLPQKLRDISSADRLRQILKD